MLAVGDKTGETVTFAAKFNKFFDCLNVTSYTEGRQSQTDVPTDLLETLD